MRIVTLARSRWVSNYYKIPATGSSDQFERRCWNENHVPAEAGPPGPRLSSPGERERNAAVARRVGGGSICCSTVQSPTHLSQIIPFVTLSNPFKWSERYIFLKNCVRSSLFCWICFCLHLHMIMLHMPKSRVRFRFVWVHAIVFLPIFVFWLFSLFWCCIVYNGCNQSSSVIFYAVLESLYLYIDAIFNVACAFPSSFLDKYCLRHIWDVRCEFSCSLVNLLKFFPRPLQEWSRLSYEGDSPGVYPFDEISAISFDFE